MRRILVVALVMALSVMGTTSGYAGSIGNLFSQSVFNVYWTDTIDMVKEKYPEGKVKTYKTVQVYKVRDPRPVMKIQRGEKDEISYGFADGVLTNITIDFGSFERSKEIMSQLSTYFGDPEEPVSDGMGGYFWKWKKDGDIDVRLILGFGGFMGGDPKLTLSISRTPSVNKGDMGF